jgi:2-polyprenyl-6-methoxyphenol hydroxylase-like FAD-dependent oxidoreductase
VRPHTGSGTSKAADDAVSLAEAFANDANADIRKTLESWASNRRGALAHLLKRGPELAASFGLGTLDE